MWSCKLLARAGRLGYDITIRGTNKKPAENTEAKTQEDTILNQINKNTYNDLFLAQDDTVCFQIVE